MDPPKRVPLLPGGGSKAKEEAKTHCFQLKLPESNDTVYPEFSWRDLIRDDEKKRAKEKNATTTGHVLDPYASDDDDALKAMAAKFEEKYNNNPAGSSSPIGKARKRKRQAEDYIDKGAGYDETDSFIDNTDIYDEVVPEDCQTVYGGFYINSGALEFKEAEVSEGEDTKIESPVKKVLSKPQLKPEIPTGNAASGTPAIVQTAKCKIRNENSDPPKKRRDSTSSQLKKARRKSIADATNLKKVHTSPPENILKVKHEDDIDKVKEKGSKSNPMVISSSSSSGSSSSEEDSSSSGSESSEDGVTKKNKLIKATIFRKSAAIVSANANANNPNKPIPVNPNPQRRLKVKNVPLNPKLHGGINPVVPTPATATPMSNRDIFSSSASSVKGLSSLPMGLTVTPNTLPPKSSPSIGSMNIGLDLKSKSSSGISVNPIISKVKRQRPPKLNSMLSSSGSPPNKFPKSQKTSPIIQQHLQPSATQLMNQAKYANQAIMTSYQNYQLQSASLAALAGLRPPYAPEAKKKARNLNKNKANNNNSRNNNIVPPAAGPYGGGPSSQLGTAITVTELKEKNSNRHSTPAVNSAFNNKSLNLSGGKGSGSGNNSPVNMTRLPASITITNSSNSPALNLSTSPSSIQAHHSKAGALNLAPNSRKNFKVTPHDVNSLLNYSANVNSILANNQNSTQHSLDKLYGNGVPIGRDSQKNK